MKIFNRGICVNVKDESALVVNGSEVMDKNGVFKGSVNTSNRAVTPNPVLNQTITDIDAQNGTPTIAQILGGIVTHNSKTGAGTVTVPTGAAMSAGVSGVAVGTTIKWLYYNRGNQTATITQAASGHTLVGGTAAVTTGKHMEIISVCTAADTWVSYLQTLM